MNLARSTWIREQVEQVLSPKLLRRRNCWQWKSRENTDFYLTLYYKTRHSFLWALMRVFPASSGKRCKCGESVGRNNEVEKNAINWQGWHTCRGTWILKICHNNMTIVFEVEIYVYVYRGITFYLSTMCLRELKWTKKSEGKKNITAMLVRG